MKLTQAYRDGIIERAIHATFDPRRETLQYHATQVAESIYLHAFGTHCQAAAALPEFWTHHDTNICVKCEGLPVREVDDGSRANLHWSKKHMPFILGCALPFHKEKVVPHRFPDAATDINKKHPLYPAVQELIKEAEQIAKDLHALRTSLKALLMPVTTFKGLYLAWPEGEKFFPPALPKRSPIATVGLKKKVNAMLGLPA